MALYPPVVASSMPAFDINDKQVRVYFTLSSYNSLSEIAAAHISVRRQTSNANVLNSVSEIMQKTIQQQDIDRALNRYFITILDSDIKGSSSSSEDSNKTNFEVDVLYKVQIRLSSVVSTSEVPQNDFFTTNIENFSQWSTVCIIKPINAPEFYIDQFHVDGQQANQEDVNYFSFPFADFTGIYKASQSSQVLKTWRLRLLSSNYEESQFLNIDEYTLADSGIVSISAYNYTLDSSSVVFNCNLPYNFSQQEQEADYKLFFEIVTKNDYKGSLLYNFIYHPQSRKQVQGTLNTYINEEEGYIKINLTLTDEANKNYVLRRSDAKSRFKKWEDLIIFQWDSSKDVFSYYDFTAESGTLYNYCVQYIDPRGRRYTPLYIQSYVMAQWEHAFLLESNLYGQPSTTKQLKLKFDFQISSYKTNIAQSKTDTIGSRYPYIRRNGNMYYRSFPCSGTITGYMDNAELFISKNEVLNFQTTAYNTFQGEEYNKFVNKYDYTYERKFREYVEQFLYNIKPKLYKSMQEGNILIKLMDVSLTPKQQLGRLVYTFSATAYEIDAATITNYDYYNIIHIGEYDPVLGRWIGNGFTYEQVDDKGDIVQVEDIDFVQQLISNPEQGDTITNIFKAGYDIIGTGQRPAANSVAVLNDYGVSKPSGEDNYKIITKMRFKSIRIQVESNPYLIFNDNGKLRIVDDIGDDRDDIGPDGSDSPTIVKPLYQIQSMYNTQDIYLGTLLKINGQDIIISPPNNIYQIKEDDLQNIDNLSIIPAKDTVMTINYVVNLYEQEDIKKIAKIVRTNNINSQIDGVFNSNDDIINRIKFLYQQEYQTEQYKVEREFKGVRSINIDANPNVVAQAVIDNNSPVELIINETGELFIDLTSEQASYITSLKFKGIRVSDSIIHQTSETSPQYLMDYDKFYNSELEEPAYQIWYKGEGRDILSQDEDFCLFSYPVEALIFYFATQEESYY